MKDKSIQSYAHDFFTVYKNHRKLYGYKKANENYAYLLESFVKQYIVDNHKDFTTAYKPIQKEIRNYFNQYCFEERETQNDADYLLAGICSWLLRKAYKASLFKEELYTFLDGWFIERGMFDKSIVDQYVKLKLGNSTKIYI